MIYFFDENAGADVGGKARGLYRLAALGFDIPPFFVVGANTDIYSDDFPRTLEACAQRLGGELFSVRSSGAAEDGDGASFAGQFSTELNVPRGGLYDAVKRVAASATAKTVSDYVGSVGTRRADGIAVIVQRQIAGKRSGVLFTSSPFSRDETVIESVNGGGDKLVGGEVAPDRRVYKKSATEITNEVDARLVNAAKILEEREGKPMDVEFCFDGKLWFLQLRPQTVLPLDVDTDKNWNLYVYRDFCPLCHSVQSRAALPDNQRELFGFAVPIFEGLLVAGREFYTDGNDEKCRDIWKSLDKPDFFEDFAHKIRVGVSRTKRRVAKLKKTDFSALSDDRLFSAYRRYMRYYLESYIPMMMRPDDYLLSKLVAAVGDTDAKTLTAALSATVGSTAYSMERETFLAACVTGDARGYIEKYGWINNPLSLNFTQMTESDFFARADGVDAREELNKLKAKKRAEKRDAQKFLSRYKVPESVERLCALIREFIFLRTHTAENSDRFFYYIRTRILGEMARRKGADVKDMLLLDCDEVAALERSPMPAPAEFRRHKSGETIIFDDGEYSTVFGSQAYALLARLQDVPAPTDGVYRGDVACGGEVTAEVRVVDGFADAKLAKAGSIIVTSMTTPEISAALDRAVGIITDEGGITCHAAIVAREYGVPCLVGTRVATQVLKTGMKVKLDCISGYFETVDDK